MNKRKIYLNTKFSEEVIRKSQAILDSCVEGKKNIDSYYSPLKVEIGNDTWTHDNDSEFFSDYRKSGDEYDFGYKIRDRNEEDWKEYHIGVSNYVGSDVIISVEAPQRRVIESVFAIFEEHAVSSRLPEIEISLPKPIVFIGHGRSTLWRDLKDHLTEQHGIAVEAYETGARAGHAIRDILEDMSQKSTFALLVLTGEDLTEDKTPRARQNVIHEAGIFQGKLGFNRAIILVEDEVELFSNIEGIQQIRFRKGNIRETFGDVLATLRREFGSI